jgi:quinoprotein glucose dehydrogenase
MRCTTSGRPATVLERCRRPLLGAALTLPIASAALAGQHDWPVYGGNAAGNHYSPLVQITRANVQRLREAWRFDAGETGDTQTSPIVVDGIVYAYTPQMQVVALDGASGARRWLFDARIRASGPQRGLAYWHAGRERRLLASVMNYLYALDPASGRPIESFGDHGRIDLREGLRGDPSRHYVSMTSPGVIYRDLIIVGFRTGESHPAPPGDIRAYDVRSGRLRWSFHTIPHPGEPGYDAQAPELWRTAGAANNWAGMVLDEHRGIVYVPTGSMTSDFYGADRPGNDLYADTLLALDAATGRRLWHFQTTHHDLWDRDLPAARVLLRVRRGGRTRDAVAQTSKQGYVYLFDRVSGAPLFPIEERAFPPSKVPGEASAATQPLPVKPAPFARQRLTEELLTTRTPAAHAWAVQQFRGFRSDGQYVPLGTDRPTVVFPGFDGGAEWGGAALDPRRAVLYVNANDVAWTGMLSAGRSYRSLGEGVYDVWCAACHGPQRRGAPPAMPALVGIGERLSAAQVEALIRTGRGRMPPVAWLDAQSIAAVTRYVREGYDDTATLAPLDPDSPNRGGNPATMAPMFLSVPLERYRFNGYQKFLDPDGYPAVAPPWGTLSAIDMNTGEYLWRIPLGEYPELAAQGLQGTGSENYGGPILTASGLLFIGATIYDRKFRAFDGRSGALLWETEMPYAGTATPITYMTGGRQYVLICTSSARNPKAPQGSAYVAYGLP